MSIKIRAPVIEGCDDDGAPYKARMIREADWLVIKRLLRAAHKWYTSPRIDKVIANALDDGLSEAVDAFIERFGK